MNETFQAQLQQIERHAADVYRHLENADPQNTHVMIAQRYTSPDTVGPWMQSGLGHIDVDLENIDERMCMVFFETLQNPEVRGSIFDASEALHRVGFRTRRLTCSRGMVKVQSFRYEIERIPLDYGWTLLFECMCLGGRVSKTIYEKPTVQALVVKIKNVFEAHFVGKTASLIFVRPTLVDIRPVICEVRTCAETYGCTTFETTIPLEWVSRLWVTT
jgi:hypothetical protein